MKLLDKSVIEAIVGVSTFMQYDHSSHTDNPYRIMEKKKGAGSALAFFARDVPNFESLVIGIECRMVIYSLERWVPEGGDKPPSRSLVLP